MSGKFNAANTDYNKDATFADLKLDGTCKVTLSEAIAKDSHENYITVYGFVELPLVGVEQMGKPMWVFEPTLCKFRLFKKSFETEYNGKKNSNVQTPGMAVAVKLITENGFDKPFKGMFDLSMAEAPANTLLTGKHPDGTDANPAELTMMSQFFANLSPIDKLDKLEGKEIKEQQGGKGGYGGAKGQTEADKLKDRVAFIKAQMLPDSDIAMILVSQDGKLDESLQRAMVHNLINSLFN